MARKWEATIEIRTGGRMDEIVASRSDADLQYDQTVAAVREAALFLTEDTDVLVVLWKTTQARGPERDRIFRVSRDRKGRTVYYPA